MDLSELVDKSPYNEEAANEIRTKHVTDKLTNPAKMELYSASTKGDVEAMKMLLTSKSYPALEECSQPGYFWTILHYASHFGHSELVEYLISYFDKHKDKFEIFNLQTIEGKSPVMCAITSSKLDPSEKKKIVEIWIKTNLIDFNLKTKKNKSIIDLTKENKIYADLYYFLTKGDDRDTLQSEYKSDLVTDELTLAQKRELYDAAVRGNAGVLKDLLYEQEYDPLEECSKKGCLWTTLHYASHFGHASLIQMLIKYFNDHPRRQEIFNLQTSEGKTPLFCAISSKDLSKNHKKKVATCWLKTGVIDYSKTNHKGEDLKFLAKRFHLENLVTKYEPLQKIEPIEPDEVEQQPPKNEVEEVDISNSNENRQQNSSLIEQNKPESLHNEEIKKSEEESKVVQQVRAKNQKNSIYKPKKEDIIVDEEEPEEEEEEEDVQENENEEEEEDEYEDETPNKECLICYEKEKNAVFIPCGHVCTCIDCGKKHKAAKKSCPLCRTQITQVIRIYL